MSKRYWNCFSNRWVVSPQSVYLDSVEACSCDVELFLPFGIDPQIVRDSYLKGETFPFASFPSRHLGYSDVSTEILSRRNGILPNECIVMNDAFSNSD